MGEEIIVASEDLEIVGAGSLWQMEVNSVYPYR
jgi:hypothetical protein